MISRPAATPSRAGSRQPLVVELSAFGGRPSPLMGGKVPRLYLHSRLTGEVHLAGFGKYWRRAMPARISAAGFSCPGRGRLLCVLGRVGTAIDEPAWRFVDRRRLAALQRAAAVPGFRTAAHFQPDASPRSRSARPVREMTVRILPPSQFLDRNINRVERGAAFGRPFSCCKSQRQGSMRLSGYKITFLTCHHQNLDVLFIDKSSGVEYMRSIRS